MATNVGLGGLPATLAPSTPGSLRVLTRSQNCDCPFMDFLLSSTLSFSSVPNSEQVAQSRCFLQLGWRRQAAHSQGKEAGGPAASLRDRGGREYARRVLGKREWFVQESEEVAVGQDVC